MELVPNALGWTSTTYSPSLPRRIHPSLPFRYRCLGERYDCWPLVSYIQLALTRVVSTYSLDDFFHPEYTAGPCWCALVFPDSE